MAGKTQSQKKKVLDMRSKMYLVLALCSVMLLVSVGISLVLIGGIGLGGADAQSVSTVDSASMVVESGYNKEENTIDTQAYTSTILEQTADAGDSYVDETLFLGDSNTARMYRMFDFCTYDNAIGSVGMTAKSLAAFACVQVSTSPGYITMPQAVAGYYTALAKESGAVVKRVPGNKLQKMCGTPDHQGVAARAAEEGARYIPICAKTEEDIADYSPEEKKAFLAEMGIEASGLDNLITASYDLLGLISFLTDGKKECRAWTIRKGTKAPQAAGKIHSDFERGFIRASVIGYGDLEANNFDYAAVKAKGLQRTEGKEYVVKDGDVIEFLFNV